MNTLIITRNYILSIVIYRHEFVKFCNAQSIVSLKLLAILTGGSTSEEITTCEHTQDARSC